MSTMIVWKIRKVLSFLLCSDNQNYTFQLQEVRPLSSRSLSKALYLQWNVR